MVKDEIDIIDGVIRHMLNEVDEIIVADNGSRDGTRDVLEFLPVTVIDDGITGYYQSWKMSNLASIAYEKGATWVVPFDADEWWTSPWGRLADVLRNHEPDYGIITADVYDHVCTGLDDENNPDPLERIRWRRDYPLKLQKVAARAEDGLVIEQGNHWARHRIPARFPDHAPIVVHHFPYRSVEQVIRKVRNGAAAYAATGTDLPLTAGQHWRQWGEFTDEQIADLFSAYYWRQEPQLPLWLDGEEQPPLVLDAVL